MRKLIFSLVVIVGASCAVLGPTIWRHSSPQAAEPFYTELPGVDLSGMPAARKEAVLKQLNRQRCPCDCMRSVASCRNSHGCSLSLAAARRAVEAAAKE